MTAAEPAAAGGPPKAVARYALSVIAAGLLACGVGVVVGIQEGFAPAMPWLAAIFAVSMVVAEVLPVQLLRKEDQAVITVSLAYFCALIFVLPGYGAVLAVGAGSALADSIRRVAPLKVAFNAAMFMLAIFAGTTVLRLGGAQQLVGRESTDVWFFLSIVAACVTIYVVNTLLLMGVVAILEDDAYIATVRQNFLASLPTDGMLLPLGPILVVVGESHPVLLPFAMLLTAVVYLSARIAAERQHDATRDPLSGLLNRRAFDAAAEAAEDKGHRTGTRLALFLMDLNGFKSINDSLGHHVGDDVIIDIARRLEAAAPADALVARMGGDEFAVLLPEVSGAEDAVVVAERLCAVFDTPICPPHARDTDLFVTGSIGLAVSGPGWSTITDLARAADAAMYACKRRGGRYLLANADLQQGSERHQSLRRAIDTDELFLVFQPLVDTRTEAVLAFEALARWEHPEHGLIPPSEFIPDVEVVGGLAGPFTARILDDALAALVQVHAAGHRVQMQVNVSTLNLVDPTFVDTVIGALERHAVEGRWLVLEITETALMAEAETARRTLQQLMGRGIKVSLDDFGSGHSSLSMLQDIPLTGLKVDRSFTADAHSERGAAMLRLMVQLAHLHGLQSTAEGVEDKAVQRQMAAAGFDVVQGYGIARPMSLDQTLAWLAGRASLEVTVDLDAAERASGGRTGIDLAATDQPTPDRTSSA